MAPYSMDLRTRVLAAQVDRLEALIREQPDWTIAELQAALRTPAALSTIWRMMKQLGTAAPRPLHAHEKRARRTPYAETDVRRQKTSTGPLARWRRG